MSQDDTVLQALKAGEVLTPALAWDRWRMTALHSAIARLREKGHDITCTMRSGNRKRWGEYRLVEQLRLVA